MNLNVLMDILLSQKVETPSDNFDPISDLRKFIDSPSLCQYVSKTLENEIIPALDKIHKDHIRITVKVYDNSIIILKDSETIFKSGFISDIPSNYRYFHRKNIKKQLIKCIDEYASNQSIILNYDIEKSLQKNTKDYFDEIFLFVIESLSQEITVTEIQESDMFRSSEKIDLRQLFQYFYKREDKHYCAYIKSNKIRELNSVSDFIPLSFSVARASPKIEEGLIKTRLGYMDKTKEFLSKEEYVLYVIKKLYERCNLVSFYEDCFSKIGYNDFLKCFIFLFYREEKFQIIAKEYCEKISDNQKPFFYEYVRKMSSNISTSETPDAEDKIIEKLKDQDLSEKSSISYKVDELHTFFKYLFENHKNFFFKYKEDLCKIMDANILRTLKSLISDLRKKVYYIIVSVNLRKEKIDGNHNCGEILEIIKRELSSYEIATISKLHDE